MSGKKNKRKTEQRKDFLLPFLMLGLTIFMVTYIFVLRQQKSIAPYSSELQKLISAYPDHLQKIEGDSLVWKDGTKMLLFDSIDNKTPQELLERPSLVDQFRWAYKITDSIEYIEKNYDPGRIRYLPFFKKMYGETKGEVKKNLVEIDWLPKSIAKKIWVTSINGVDEKLKLISKELDEFPSLNKYLKNPGGTFKWRKIKGTDRLSPHSFGMTIDINIDYSNYWQWDCKCENEAADQTYKNRIPMKVVKIFEKHGFIWGGRWYHYDTMHFEYRPELIPEEREQ